MSEYKPWKLTEEMIDAACEIDAREIAIAENKRKYPGTKDHSTNGQEFAIRFHAALAAAQLVNQGPDRAPSYDLIDRYLRNNLDDTDYAEYSAALETVWGTTPVTVPERSEQ